MLAEDATNAAAHAGLIRAHLAMGEVDKAEAMARAIPEDMAKNPAIQTACAQVALARHAADAGPVDTLRAAVGADPDDHAARFDLATALQASGDTQAAVDHLLEICSRDREWNDGAAKARLFTIFTALKPDDPIALKARRRLSSLIFT